jgi:hypothetical protein
MKQTGSPPIALPAAQEWTVDMTTEDRTRAIAWLEKQAKCLAMPGAAKMFGLAAEALNAGRWISVSERLPDDVGSYLVYYHEWSNGDFLPKYDDYRIRVMRFLNNGKWCMPVCTDKRCEADTNREVTHWMPLSEPPRKEN